MTITCEDCGAPFDPNGMGMVIHKLECAGRPQAGTLDAAALHAKISRDRANLKAQLDAIHARAVQREIETEGSMKICIDCNRSPAACTCVEGPLTGTVFELEELLDEMNDDELRAEIKRRRYRMEEAAMETLGASLTEVGAGEV